MQIGFTSTSFRQIKDIEKSSGLRPVRGLNVLNGVQMFTSRTFVADVIKNEFFPFFWCPNAILTPHIAGSTGKEPQRMAYYMMAEMEKLVANEPTQYEVTLASLERMA